MRSFTPLYFFETRFTAQEQYTIATAALAGDAELFLFLVKFCMAQLVQSSDSRLEQARQLLIAKGLLTQDRADQIFSFED